MNEMRAVVLAAGKGSRLQTEGIDLPKVMRQALGKPLLYYVLRSIRFIDKKDIDIVVGYKRDKVMSAFPEYRFDLQEEQLGTGHAVMSAKRFLEETDGNVLICYGDMPLFTENTFRTLIKTHEKENNVCTILTGTSDEKLPYGRILRDENGHFLGVVEDKDCTPEQKKIDELNVGVYVFNARRLVESLSKLKNNNAQGEYYLTDVPYILLEEGDRVGICKLDLGPEIIGVNTVEQLQQVENILKKEEA